MEFGVSVLLRPEVERDGGEFVYEGVGESVLGEVDGLDIGVTSVATLDADIGQLGSGVDRKLGMVFLAAPGTDDAAELPFGEADTAEQAAAAAVALLTEHAESRFPIAKWAQQRCIAFQLHRSAGAGQFGVGLKESEHEEFLRIGGRVDVDPALGEKVSPGTRIGVTHIVRHLGEARRSSFFDDGKE